MEPAISRNMQYILHRINKIPIVYIYVLRYVPILSSHLCLGLPKCFFPVGLYCIEGVVIGAQSTATFSDVLCCPEFTY